jgi:OFA family oxalate/formate antiporter-like MFS transporter
MSRSEVLPVGNAAPGALASKILGRPVRAVTGFVLLLFLGLIYAWSVFIVPLEAEFGWNRQQTSLAFTLCMSTFCLGGLASGLLSKKISSQWKTRLCAVFVLLGFGLASRINTLAGLYITYGVFVGLGIGIAYNTVISNIVLWFHEKPGFISGILLMGFGFGGMVFGTAATVLIGIYGWRVIFAGIAGIYFLLVMLCSFVISPPKSISPAASSQRSAAKSYTTREMMGDPRFWVYFAWTVCLSSGGLAIIGHASPFAIDMGVAAQKAAFYAGLISVFNGAGRVIFGALFDLIGRRLTMLMVSLGLVIACCILLLALHFNSVTVLITGFIFTGLSYGGIMPCNSTVINRFYGQKHYAMNFSIITMNVMAASLLGPFLAGALQKSSGSYALALYVFTSGGLLSTFLGQIIRDRTLPQSAAGPVKCG